MKYVVSACLAGVACRYDGKDASHPFVMDLVASGEALPVCPELLGGLGAPRCPCELVNGRAQSADGRNCDAAYRKGSAEALRLARAAGCTHAVLKARSPSCGVGCVYDGTFTHTRARGDGVFGGLLRQTGFTLMTEEDLPACGGSSVTEPAPSMSEGVSEV